MSKPKPTLSVNEFKKIILKVYLSRYGKLIRFGFAPFLRVPKNRPYVFIVGCYNSGTTLLDYILGRHSEISTLPTEGVVLTSELSKPENFGWPRMWYKCANKISIDENDMAINLNQIKKVWGFWFDNKKSIFLEKSISNSARIKWINMNFNQAYFIWIIRNGYCVAEGIRRRSKQSKVKGFKYRERGYPIEWCAEQWVVNNKIIEEDTRNIKRLMKISYEELTDNLAQTVRSVLEWLPVNNKNVTYPNTFKFHGKEKKIKNMNAQSIAKLSAHDIENINKIAGSHLKKWGYSILDKKRNILDDLSNR